MSLSLRCPFCKTRLKIPESMAGKRISCPKCDSQLIAPQASAAPPPTPTPKRVTKQPAQKLPEPVYSSTGGRSTFIPDDADESSSQPAPLTGDSQLCPSCDAVLDVAAVFCTHCGYDFVKKRRRKRKRKKKVRFEMERVEGKKALQPAGWSDIFHAPFDVENVVTESIMLSVWSVVYFFLALSLLLPLIHPIFAFCLLLVFANYLRIMIVHKDWQFIHILMGMGLFIFVWFAGGQILGTIFQVDPQSFGGFAIYVILFFFLAYLCIFLRMISQFFGKYFAICSRSAYGALMSGDDRGGLVDLGYVIVISFIAWTPFFIACVIAGAIGALADFSPASIMTAGSLMLPTLLWAYFYFPMAATVAAIEYSVNPLLVLHWCTVCFWDYVKLLLLFIPFFTLVTAISFGLGLFLEHVMPAITVVPKELYAMFNFFVVSNFLNQYIYVVLYTCLGLMARMHEPELGWYE